MRWTARRCSYRPLSRRPPIGKRGLILILALLFCVGFWVGIVVSMRALAEDGVARINREANRVAPHLDASLPDGVFDCEDYAWAKINALWAAGLSRLEPRAVVVRIPGIRQAHMVVLLNDGRVLDNRYGNVQTRAGLERWPGYQFQ